MKYKVKCDKCRTILKDITPKVKKKGDIEYTYFKCHKCGKLYMVSVTDGKLRKQIKKYQLMAARIRTLQKKGKVTYKDLEDAAKLHKQNVARNKELMMLYQMPEGEEENE